MIDSINQTCSAPFSSLESCLNFYREKLPQRTAGYHQDEVGPIYPSREPNAAMDFCKGIFHLGQTTVEMPDGLDWYTAPEGDLEWNGGLVRHGYFTLLADAYEQTGNERFAETVISHMLDYIESVPPFDPEGKLYIEYKKSTWRPFEAAARAGETWPEALGKVIGSPAMTPERWGRILLSIHEHAAFLDKHHWKTGNHAVMEVADLGIISLFFPEFTESKRWLAKAVAFLDEMWPDLIHSDGYTREMSGIYQWVAIRSYVALLEVATRNGVADIFPTGYRERLHVAAMAEFAQSKPDYSVPVSNDSNSTVKRRDQLERLATLLDLPDIKHRLSHGNTGIAPEHNSVFLPESRVGFMRSDWSDKAHYLYFDMGRWGDNHMNEDQLSIEVSALGRMFLVASGRWRYTTSDPDAEWMPWARYFKSTASYNTVMVNGYNQVFGDAAGFMSVYPVFDYAEGTYEAGYGEIVPGVDQKLLIERGLTTKMETRVKDVIHRRKILFVKPFFWVIRDEITGADLVEAEQIWHFREGEISRSLERPHFWHTQFSDANLWVGTFSTNGATDTASNCLATTWKGSEEPIAGWHCPYYDIMTPAPELRFRASIEQGSAPAASGDDKTLQFHTLLLPVPGSIAGAPEFTVESGRYIVKAPSLEREYQISAPSTGEWSISG